MAVGSGLILLGRGAENRVTRRDGYCIVAFTWLLFTGFGMLPFYISGSIPSVTDAFFETMSGFTTTGATILDDIEALSHGMLFWRSFSQWIGGLGIVFFTIAVLPIFGVGNQVLFSAEATGVTHDKIHPKISVMAQCLWTVYLVLTVAEIVLLLIGGMDLFDAASDWKRLSDCLCRVSVTWGQDWVPSDQHFHGVRFLTWRSGCCRS